MVLHPALFFCERLPVPMLPADLALNHSQLFLTRVLAGKKRVLEVGCGNGQLSWRLAHLGLQVVGLDIALPRQRPTHPRLRFEKGDFYKFKDEPFDAVLFTSSLHHLHPLEGALRRARNLLLPTGLVVLDEFDRLAADEDTARWYYEAGGLLTQAGVFKAEREHPGHRPHGTHGGHAGHGSHAGHGRPSGAEDPLARWQREHQHLPELHTGRTMLDGLRKVGELIEVTRVAYLFRSLCVRLGEAPRGLNVAEFLLQAEEQRIRGGSLRAVGLRAVCRVE